MSVSDKWEYRFSHCLFFWIALRCLFEERSGSLACFMLEQAKYRIKTRFLLMWDQPSVTAHTISTRHWLISKAVGFMSGSSSQMLTNPKPAYSSCLVPHHRPWFEPVCTGFELTATPCAVIMNLAPLRFTSFFLFLCPTPTGCTYKKKITV